MFRNGNKHILNDNDVIPTLRRGKCADDLIDCRPLLDSVRPRWRGSKQPRIIDEQEVCGRRRGDGLNLVKERTFVILAIRLTTVPMAIQPENGRPLQPWKNRSQGLSRIAEYKTDVTNSVMPGPRFIVDGP